jgi:ribosomal protein S18 acetylase RimI-like enzyme
VNDLAIRSAREDDLPAVLSLWRAAGSLVTVTDDEPSLRLLLARDADALLLAHRSSELVGSLIASWDGWRGAFYRLAVHPRHRRHGIARALLAHGEARLHDLGARRLTAMVEAGAGDALAFWQAAGFERQHDRLRYVRMLER